MFVGESLALSAFDYRLSVTLGQRMDVSFVN